VKVTISAGGQDYTVEVHEHGAALASAPPADIRLIAPGLYSVIVEGRSYEVAVHLPPDAARGAETAGTAQVDGRVLATAVVDARRRALAAAAGARGGAPITIVTVAAPMPGRISAVPVATGETVERGQTVALLEAMKMESSITAPQAGTVREILVTPGEAVQQRQALVRLQVGG
jgi:biotin carboxyl carrier protein